MYIYKLIVVFLLTGIIFAYTNCGSPFSKQSSLVWQSNVISASADSYEAFEKTVYPLTRQYCVSCHTTQAPTHASPDVKVAHDSLLSPTSQKVNFSNIPNSRIVKKLRDENHNCWSDCQANADEMQQAVQDWYDDIQAANPTGTTTGSTSGGTTGGTTSTVIKTIETMNIAAELANAANPLKTNTVAINVASAMVSAPMIKANDVYGDHIIVPDDGTNQTLAATDATAGTALMNIKLPAAGTYRVWAYLLTPDANSNSVFVGLANMGTPTTYIGGIRTVDNITVNANPSWRQLVNNIAVTAAGNYTLTIRERKDGLKIYRIFVTSDATFNGDDVASFIGVKLSFDISAIVKTPNVKFQVDVSDYDMYTYLIANPRIVTPTSNIRVKNIRMFMNNVYSPQNATYNTVDKVTTPTDGLLSGFPMIALKDKGASVDTIHFEFEMLEMYNGTVNNASLVAFQNSVYPISRANCAACHSAQRPHASPDPLTAHDYALTIVDFNTPANSLIATKIRNGHQTIGSAQGASLAAQYEAAIAQWKTGRGP